MADLQSTRDLLGGQIAYPTISSESNRALIDDIAGRLANAGARVVVQTSLEGTKAKLFATIGPEGPDGIVLCSHSDVVPVAAQSWTSDPFAMVEHDGRLYGRGSCDLKGFIAAAVDKAPDFANSTLNRPLHYAIILYMTRRSDVWARKPSRTCGRRAMSAPPQRS